jgi:hypothetical protein
MTKRPVTPPDFDSYEWDDADESEPVSFLSPEPASDVVGAGESMHILAEDPHDNAPEEKNPGPAQPMPSNMARARSAEPIILFWMLAGLSLGLTPLASSAPIERYTIMWTLLAMIGLTIYFARGQEKSLLVLQPHGLLWGAGWGLVVGFPLLLVGSELLVEASERIFVGMPDGAVFQSVVFVMATTESFFFRGVLQSRHSTAITALMSSGWSILLFFPTMNVFEYPSVALIVGTFLVMLSALYSYVRQRNGLAAAWVCQTVVSLAWLFLPRLIS